LLPLIHSTRLSFCPCVRSRVNILVPERERGRENDRLYILPFSYLFFPIVGAPTSNPSTGRTAGGQENIVPETAKKMFFFRPATSGTMGHEIKMPAAGPRPGQVGFVFRETTKNNRSSPFLNLRRRHRPKIWFLFQSDAVNVVCLAEHKFFMRLVQVIGSRRTSQAGVRRRGLTGCTHARTHAQAAAVSLE